MGRGATLSLQKARSCAAAAALVFGSASSLANVAAAVAEEPACSSDAFAIDGASVHLELCVRENEKSSAKAFVMERLSAGPSRPSFEREVPLDRVPGAESARAIDDVSLEKLGIERTLHLTIALKGTAVRLDHALLVPGAVALK